MLDSFSELFMEMHRKNNVMLIGHMSHRNWLQLSFLKETFKGREDEKKA